MGPPTQTGRLGEDECRDDEEDADRDGKDQHRRFEVVPAHES